MENAQLIGLSRQMALSRQIDVIANNMANVNTPGFRSESLVFEEVVMPVAEVQGMSGAVGRLSYVHDPRHFRDFSEGRIVTTGNPLDIALNGRGWLVVETEGGERYTRDGRLRLDAEGRLVTTSGHPLLGAGGPIAIEPEETSITIAADGTVSTSEGPKGRIRVVQFADDAALTKQGRNLYASDEVPLPADNVRIRQGAVEGSNVEAVREMSRMIEV